MMFFCVCITCNFQSCSFPKPHLVSYWSIRKTLSCRWQTPVDALCSLSSSLSPKTMSIRRHTCFRNAPVMPGETSCLLLFKSFSIPVQFWSVCSRNKSAFCVTQLGHEAPRTPQGSIGWSRGSSSRFPQPVSGQASGKQAVEEHYRWDGSFARTDRSD